MNTALLKFYNELPQAERNRGSLLPAGRLIRSATKRATPLSAPANSDMPRQLIRSGREIAQVVKPEPQSRGFIATGRVISSGFLVPALASAMLLHPASVVDDYNSTRTLKLMKHESSAQTRELQRDKTPQSLVLIPSKQIIAQTEQRAAPSTLLPHAPQTATKVGGGMKTGSFRLASFTTPVLREQMVPEQNGNEKGAARAPSIKLFQYTSMEAPKMSKGALAKVQAIISKYAPKHDSPHILAETIVKESSRQGYDPLFVAAVIKTESTFNAKARSFKGAQGLMQIMPATGVWLSEKNEVPRGKLNDPRHNLTLGISYLKHLEQEYNGDKMFTLVAYNWGPGRVESATGGKRRVPRECLSYALRILNDYRRWKSGVI